MISDELQKIINEFEQKGRMLFEEGTTEEQIEQFEKEHNVQLPTKFKEWLLFSDGGYLFTPAGLQIYGITHKPLLDVDYNDRPSDNYIVIGTLCYGDPILCEKNGEKVCIYNHESGIIEDNELFSDFFTFLNNICRLIGID